MVPYIINTGPSSTWPPIHTHYIPYSNKCPHRRDPTPESKRPTPTAQLGSKMHHRLGQGLLLVLLVALVEDGLVLLEDGLVQSQAERPIGLPLVELVDEVGLEGSGESFRIFAYLTALPLSLPAPSSLCEASASLSSKPLRICLMASFTEELAAGLFVGATAAAGFLRTLEGPFFATVLALGLGSLSPSAAKSSWPS